MGWDFCSLLLSAGEALGQGVESMWHMNCLLASGCFSATAFPGDTAAQAVPPALYPRLLGVLDLLPFP